MKLALDEMRMAVDSLQPAQDDLSTLLATLRYRLQPRLDAAGIELVWNVALIPTVGAFRGCRRAATAAHPAGGLHQRAQACGGHAHRDAGALAR